MITEGGGASNDYIIALEKNSKQQVSRVITSYLNFFSSLTFHPPGKLAKLELYQTLSNVAVSIAKL